MTQTESPPPGAAPLARVILHEVAGVAMVLSGSLILLGLVYISNDPSPLAEHMLFSLGLALISLISAAAQILIVAGLAVLWATARRARRAARRDG